MEMNINKERKTVDVWLTTREAQDPAMKERLRLLYRVFADQKYLVAVFQSGRKDLVQATSDLLCYNRKRIAQLEVEHEKKWSVPSKKSGTAL